jgi:hypothetical protein
MELEGRTVIEIEIGRLAGRGIDEQRARPREKAEIGMTGDSPRAVEETETEIEIENGRDSGPERLAGPKIGIGIGAIVPEPGSGDAQRAHRSVQWREREQAASCEVEMCRSRTVPVRRPI